jgi:nucleoid-associated protein YgaU
MALRRYARSNILGINKQYGTSRAVQTIRKGIASGIIRFTTEVLREGQRLDSVAGAAYGDAALYWVIAAASDIGWTMQVPPSTILRIPNLADISELVG